jgi:RNA polymerase sigma-70 factor (ECF subfamily)
MTITEKHKSFSDDELIKMILNQKQNYLFEVLYDRYYQRVFDKSYSLLKDTELAKDAVQNIFTRTFENLLKFKGNSAFSSWLYSITYNYCIDFLRHKNQLHYPEWNSQHELPEIIDETQEDLGELDYEVLIKLLDRIHPEEKALLLMKYNDDVSIREISRSLRISESATKMRLKRARSRLLFLYQSEINSRGVE